MMKKTVAIIALLIGLGFMLIPYDALLLYKQRSNITPSDPQGTRVNNKQPIFVVQKHNASHLHYDFRLEIDGILKSWAIPKGPSTDPQDRRLAVETQDHPIDYATFEGTIPEGECGAGTVIVWDTGTFKNIAEQDNTLIPLPDCYQHGMIKISLTGTKLNGNYALIRSNPDDHKKWLLIKMQDKDANAKNNITESLPESVFSGKTIEDMENKKK